MEGINTVLTSITGVLFGPYMLAVYFGTGLYLTIRTRGIQFRKMGLAFRSMFRTKTSGEGEIRPFWALASALSSCIGVGNIAGVAAAIATGGPGAIFWMWVAAILGMATKYTEIVLAMKFREQDETGQWHGGCMYIWKNGMKSHPYLAKVLGGIFAFAAVFVGLVSCNMLQTNTVVSSLSRYHVPGWTVGILFAVLTGVIILGGIKRLGRVTSVLTPVMGLIYVAGCIVILVLHGNRIIPAFGLIFSAAFNGQAAVGGFSGASIAFAVRMGGSRGIMSNEAGIGSSAMIHSTTSAKNPCEQGLFGILEVFFDTIVVCTATALVIITTGVWHSGATSAALSAEAFRLGLPGNWGHIVVIVATVLFSYSTLLGWSWYAETGVSFLLGSRVVKPFRVIWCVFAFLGAIINITVVWNLADTVNGIMALPNLLSLWVFAGAAMKLTKENFSKGDKQ